MPVDLFIFMVLLLVNALLALALMLAARTLGQRRMAHFLAGAFGFNVLMYLGNAAYIFLFKENVWLDLLVSVTALWRPGRKLRLGERPIIVTGFAMASIEIAGGLVLAAMGNGKSPVLDQAYTWIVFLGLPAMTVAGGIFSLYLLAGDLAERLRIAADTDSLTGAPNRRALESAGSRMMAEARGAGRPLTIAICDVDHFKYVNDEHGHDCGDDVLCRLSALFQERLAAGDHFGRFGGEEFVLFFPGQDIDTARCQVEQLRQQIMAIPIGDRPDALTASFGIAAMTAEDNKLADVLKRADRALYASKEGGRNRTTADPQWAPSS